MPYSSVSEIDAGDLPSRSSFNTSFPTPVCFIPVPASLGCQAYPFAHHASQLGSRSVVYHSSVRQASVPQQQPAMPAIETSSSRIKPADSPIDTTRIKAMETTIKHLNALLKNEIKAREMDSERMTSLESELIKIKQEKLQLEKELEEQNLVKEERARFEKDLPQPHSCEECCTRARECDEAKQGRLELEKSLASSHEENCALIRELEEVKEERLELEKSLIILRGKCVSLTEELEETNQKRLLLEKNLKEAQEHLAIDCEIDNYLELVATKGKLQSLLEQVKSLQIECEGYNKCKSDLKSVTEELDTKVQIIEDCKREMARRNQVIEDSKKCMTIMLATINQLKSQEADLKTQLQQREIPKSSFETCAAVENAIRSKVKELLDKENQWRGKNEQLESELKEVKQQKGKLEIWFKDLAKEYVHVIQYNGEKMYEGYTNDHENFLHKLRQVYDEMIATGRELPGLQDSIECIQQQRTEIIECRKRFGAFVDRALRRIENGAATVSDIQFRAPTPLFEIPVERFESMLLYLKSFL